MAEHTSERAAHTRARPSLALHLAVLCTLAGLALLAAHLAFDRGANPAQATLPTPQPLDVDWHVKVGTKPSVGETVFVSAAAMPTPSSGARLDDPSYRLTVLGEEAVLALSSPADVVPAGVLDGAQWELQALNAGEAEVEIGLHYTLKFGIIGTGTGSYPVTASTTRLIMVNRALDAIRGDGSCDGAVDARDAVLVLQFVAALIAALPCELGDANADGITNAVDAAIILEYSAGLWTAGLVGEPTASPQSASGG